MTDFLPLTAIIAELQTLWNLYNRYILLIGIGAAASFFLSPLSAVIAKWVGAIDKPASQRDYSDPTRGRKVHSVATPLLGGLAVFTAAGIALFIAAQTGIFNYPLQSVVHIILAIAVLVIVAYVDCIKELPAKTQFIFQIIAAGLVTMAGIRINFIEIMGIFINFNLFNFTLQLGSIALQFSPLADLVTILWLVGIVNAINWIDGLDGLSTTIMTVSVFTMMLLGVKNSEFFAAALAASLLGGLIGFLPFNLPPAKSFIGTIGVFVGGFVLGILAIVSNTKLTTSIIVLAVPLLDMIWVLLGRFKRHYKDLNSPLDLLKINDKTHLHHRLMSLGIGKAQVLWIEFILVLISSVVAYSLAGFRDETIGAIIGITVVLIIFTIITVLQTIALRKARKERRDKDQDGPDSSRQEPEPHIEIKVKTSTPEEKYAY